jgi:hypothetical protein
MFKNIFFLSWIAILAREVTSLDYLEECVLNTSLISPLHFRQHRWSIKYIGKIQWFYSPYASITDEDFHAILKLVLCSDTYLLDGEERKQRHGIAMGNCAAPPLAIIYMDFIERQVLQQNPDVVMWVRYIDDIFFVSNSNPDDLVTSANHVHPTIKFTLEKAVDEKLAFLDTLVHRINNSFQVELYIKPTHSGTCLPSSSHVPLARKKCLVMSETIRAYRVASPQYRTNSLNKISNRLLANGYHQKFIDTIRSSLRYTPPNDKVEPITFIKVPFYLKDTVE